MSVYVHVYACKYVYVYVQADAPQVGHSLYVFQFCRVRAPILRLWYYKIKEERRGDERRGEERGLEKGRGMERRGMEYNTIQYNTIQYNTIQYKRMYGSTCVAGCVSTTSCSGSPAAALLTLNSTRTEKI